MARHYTYHRWTNKEVETLKQLYPVLPNKEVARRMGLPKSAMRMKATTLGLRKTGKRPEIRLQDAKTIAFSLAYEAVLPFAPSSKFRRKCEVMLAYCQSRINRPRYRAPYTDAEIDLYRESRKLNKKGLKIA